VSHRELDSPVSPPSPWRLLPVEEFVLLQWTTFLGILYPSDCATLNINRALKLPNVR